MRIAHIIIAVKDLEQSIGFYVDVLGMELLQQQDYLAQKLTLAKVGYGKLQEATTLALAYHWDQDNYTIDNTLGHFAIEVSNVYKACDKILKRGGKIIARPKPMPNSGNVVATTQDPNGYSILLVGIL